MQPMLIIRFATLQTPLEPSHKMLEPSHTYCWKTFINRELQPDLTFLMIKRPT